MVRSIITSSGEGRGLGRIHCIDRAGTHYRSIVVAQIPSHFVKWDGSFSSVPLSYYSFYSNKGWFVLWRRMEITRQLLVEGWLFII